MTPPWRSPIPPNCPRPQQRQAGGYFADWVMASGPEFFTRDTTEDVIIRTTLDQRLQRAAEEALKNSCSTRRCATAPRRRPPSW